VVPKRRGLCAWSCSPVGRFSPFGHVRLPEKSLVPLSHMRLWNPFPVSVGLWMKFFQSFPQYLEMISAFQKLSFPPFIVHYVDTI